MLPQFTFSSTLRILLTKNVEDAVPTLGSGRRRRRRRASGFRAVFKQQRFAMCNQVASLSVLDMDLFFETETTGRTHTDFKPLKASYQDGHGKSEFIYARYDHQLTGKSKSC